MEPLVIPVPGNHDLWTGMKQKLGNFDVLENFWKEEEDQVIEFLAEELWLEGDASRFEPLFVTYTSWLEKSISAPERPAGCCGAPVPLSG